jgi:hypothetical protein
LPSLHGSQVSPPMKSSPPWEPLPVAMRPDPAVRYFYEAWKQPLAEPTWHVLAPADVNWSLQKRYLVDGDPALHSPFPHSFTANDSHRPPSRHAAAGCRSWPGDRGSDRPEQGTVREALGMLPKSDRESHKAAGDTVSINVDETSQQCKPQLAAPSRQGLAQSRSAIAQQAEDRPATPASPWKIVGQSTAGQKLRNAKCASSPAGLPWSSPGIRFCTPLRT